MHCLAYRKCVYATFFHYCEVVPDVGGWLPCVTVDSAIVNEDIFEGDCFLVLRDGHHFHTWLKEGAFVLIDHIDFDRVGF